ncbi:MAG: hypothetical protein ACYS21_07450 [Planctomycetota bacterium]|jgi:hypothetical protein
MRWKQNHIEFFTGDKNMTALRKMLLILLCVCFVSGCYEDEAVLTINSDGSGILKHKAVLSERFMVAISDSKGTQNGPIPDKDELIKKVGSAIKVTSIKQTDTPDGGRVIELEGTFSKPEQFFLSEYCQKQIKLRLAPAGEGKAAIYCDMKKSGDSGPSLTQLYGMAKGLYIRRTVHLPTEIEKTNGYSGKTKKTVSWFTDLRDKERLAKTKEFIEGPNKGSGFAVFNASALKFTLPLKAAALPEKRVEVEKEKTQKESMGLTAKVCWISIKKKATLSDLEIGIEISWNEGHSPIACRKPVLLSLLDDQNNDLVLDRAPSVSQRKILDGEKKDKKKQLTLRAKTPAKNAEKLKSLEGCVEVITDVTTELVVLENIKELVGKKSTGNPILDRLNFRIKSIKAAALKIEINGGNERITSLYMTKEDGSRVKKRGGMGWGNEYSYDFDEDISKLNKCELEVVVSESTVKVPFSREEILLP